MRGFFLCILSVPLAVAAAVEPTIAVTQTGVSQNPHTGVVTVSYTVSSPAIVTMDVLTNGVSIGRRHLASAMGDVNCQVDANGTHVLKWGAFGELPEQKPIKNGQVKVVLTAWPTNAPPDYMVVDLRKAADLDVPRVRYFVSTNDLPYGGLFATNYFRTTAMVLRRIHAANRLWMKGEPRWESGYNGRTKFWATLDHDYYIGVFPVTQAQWALVQENAGVTDQAQIWPSYFSNPDYRTMRPVEKVKYNDIRNTKYPAGPHASSWLGRISSQTFVSFDLPGDAQWEYACRGDTLDGFWNDGSPMTKANDYGAFKTCPNLPGRYSGNSNSGSATADSDGDSGTAIVGSYRPSTWGLYDMHGNVMEFCLDYQQDNSVIAKWRGAINANGNNALDGTGSLRFCVRGGCWQRDAYQEKSSQSNGEFAGNGYSVIGFRVVVNLK